MSVREASRPADAGPEMSIRGPVAVVLSRFPTVTETFILREIDEMERQGQPVRLVPLLREDPPVVHDEARAWMDRALFTPFLSTEILAANLRTFREDPGRYLSVLGSLVRGTFRSPAFLARSLALFPNAVYLARRLEAEGLRHVHAHFATHPTTVAWVIAALTDLTYSVTVHAHDIFVDRTFLEDKLRAAAFVRVISAFNRDYLLSRFPALDPAKIRVVHVGVEVDRYAPVPGRAGRALSGPGVGAGGDDGGGSRPLVLAVASLRRYKGISVLLEACYLLRTGGVSFRCEVAGDGPLRDELEALVAAFGLEDRVRFLGAVPETTVRDLLGRASVFVLPSLVQEDGQMDGIPVALMEAMASGVPVVASELSGIPELVEDQRNGFLVPPGSPEAVATGIRALLGDHARARRMGERGRDKVRRDFSLRGTVAQLLELLEEHVGAVDIEVRDRLRASQALLRRTASVGVRRVHEGRDAWVAELLLADRLPSGAPRPDRTASRFDASDGDRPPPGNGTAWPREVVLKVHRSRPGASAPAGQRARTEFEILRTLADPAEPVSRWRLDAAEEEGRSAAETSSVTPAAPRALHVDEGAATVIMTRCGGVNLLAKVRASRWPWTGADEEELVTAFRRTGVWLREFQERTRLDGSSTSAMDLAALETRQAVDDLEGRLLESAEAHAVRQELLDLCLQADPGEAPVLRHGDFWPGNVHLSRDGRVAVLDFEGVAPGHPLEDPAYFVVQLGLFFAYPGLARRGRVLETAFLEGFGHPSAWGSAAFELYRRAAAARILRSDDGVERPARPTDRFRRRALLSTLRGDEP